MQFKLSTHHNILGVHLRQKLLVSEANIIVFFWSSGIQLHNIWAHITVFSGHLGFELSISEVHVMIFLGPFETETPGTEADISVFFWSSGTQISSI